MALPERIASLLVGRTEREIVEGLRHEIRETLQTISDSLNNTWTVDCRWFTRRLTWVSITLLLD